MLSKWSSQRVKLPVSDLILGHHRRNVPVIANRRKWIRSYLKQNGSGRSFEAENTKDDPDAGRESGRATHLVQWKRFGNADNKMSPRSSRNRVRLLPPRIGLAAP